LSARRLIISLISCPRYRVATPHDIGNSPATLSVETWWALAPTAGSYTVVATATNIYTAATMVLTAHPQDWLIIADASASVSAVEAHPHDLDC
jgi:hypothetical protein